jgi:hypothetical protein
MNSVIEATLNVNKIESSFSIFFNRFHISTLFHQCRIEKKRGIPCPHLFTFVLLLLFTGKNLYRHYHPCSTSTKKGKQPASLVKQKPSTKQKLSAKPKHAYGDDTVYRFLQDATFHWKKFLTLLTKRIIYQFLQPLNEPDRVTVFTIDDTLLRREESDDVELLSRHHDHSHQTKKNMVKGFNLLTLGYDDGSTFLPVDFTLMTAPKYYVHPWESRQWKQELQPSSLAYQRREVSTLEKPVVALQMLKRAMKQGIIASYVLFDSWFASSSLIKKISKETGMDTICMLKRGTTLFGYQHKMLTLSSLFDACKKRYGKNGKQGGKAIEIDDKTKLFGSLVVTMGKKTKQKGNKGSKGSKVSGKGTNLEEPEDFLVKIVFVQNRNKKAKQRVWLAILSTDISLSDEEIIRIYGKRWDIEVFFKSIKSLLKVEKEYHLQKFDSINAHIAIVCCRYCYLAWLSRIQQDPRTIGDLFYQVFDEMEDLRFKEALERVIKMFLVFLQDTLPEVAAKIKELFTLFVRSLPCYMLQSLDILICGE